MKALFSLLCVAALVGGVYLLSTGGCGARGAVARDKVVDQIDALLGKLNVQQKEVEIQFDKLTADTRKLQESKIRAQVNLETITNDKKAKNEKLASIDSGLKRLQPMLVAAQATGETIEGGKTFTIEQLKTIADSAIKERKGIVSELDGRVKTLEAAWTKNLDFLTKQDSSAGDQLATLDKRIEEIKAKKSSIDAVREASLIAGPNESINDKFEKLNSDVDKLFVEVETSMRVEEAKLDEQLANMESSSMSIEELLKDDTDVSGTLGEIDAILGGGSTDKPDQ